MPLSASEMSISVFNMTSTRSLSSTQSASASRYRSTSGGPGQRELGGSAQPGKGRAEIVRHVVEGAAHRGHESFDLVEHRVEQDRQLVDGVAVTSAAVSGTRASVRPVRMIRRTAWVSRRIG